MIFIFSFFAFLPLVVNAKNLKKALLLSEYIEADWTRAVKGGKVISEFEYREMIDFCGEILRILEGTELEPDANELCKEILKKTDRVQKIARKIKLALLPKAIEPPHYQPSFEEGKKIFEQRCASCHAGEGRRFEWKGEKWWAFPLTSPHITPAKVFLITLFGIEGTPMTSFKMSDSERWSLSYFVGSLKFAGGKKLEGGKLEDWKILKDITFDDVEVLLKKYQEKATEVYFSVFNQDDFAIVLSMVEDALQLAKVGKEEEAKTLLESAYLRFEKLEPFLGSAGMKVELAFARARTSQNLVEDIKNILNLLEERRGNGAKLGKTLASFTIVFREGFEAVLIVTAISRVVSQVFKSALPLVHVGWISGIFAGVLLWLGTGLFVKTVSNRELVEGVMTLIAVLIIIWASWWVLSAIHERRMKKMIESLKKASGKIGIFSLTFLATARESGEVVFMLRALGGGYELGFALGILALFPVIWIVVFLGKKLPTKKFFILTNVLLNVIAVMLIGKAIADLQEAGVIPVSPVNVPFPFDIIFPSSFQAIAVQIGLAVFLFVTTFIYLRMQKVVQTSG